MKLPKFAINNFQFSLMVFILLTIAGITSYINMPRTENPSVYIPGASVTVIYPGANPNDMEELVASPIEEAINELDDIKKMNTTLKDGIAVIGVEFSYETDAHEKYDEVVRQVNSIKSQLPSDITELDIMQWTSSDVSILQLALVSEKASYSRLNNMADELKKEIEKANGIKRVNIHAIPEEQVKVELDLEKMAAMNISIHDIEQAVQSYNANIPGGSIKIGSRFFGIKTSGSYKELEEIKNTVITSYQGRIIYLRHIADVCYGYEDINYMARFNGKRCVFVSVKQKADINIYKIMEDIRPRIKNYKKELGQEIELATVFDQSQTIDRRISGFMQNLFQGIIAVGILILLTIGFKSSIIVIIAIPLSVVIGLFFVDISGFGLQQISIAALVVALGLLVDNSIVMIENISRHLSMGKKPRQAAIDGATEIGWPIISATITTLLAFIPIILMPDKAGDFIRSLPVTIVATLSISLLIALSLSPLIAAIILKNKKNHSGKLAKYKIINFLHSFIEGPYRRTLTWALKHKAALLILAAIILGISLYAFTWINVSFFPKAEAPQFMVRVNMPEGTNIDQTSKTTRWVESVLDTIPDVKRYAANIGNGNPRIYYNIFPKQYAKNFSEIYVELHEYEAERFYNLIAQLRKTFSQYTGAEINIKEWEQGVPQEAPVVVYILGDDVDVLQDISGKVEQWVDESKGAINIENQLNKVRTNLYFDINKEKAGVLGVPVHRIDKTIRASINGINISKFHDPSGDEYEIILGLPKKNGDIQLNDMEKIYVESVTGRMIPLKQLADIEFKKAPTYILRYNMQRNAAVMADLKKGANLDDVMEPVLKKLENYTFPPGYDYHIAGELEARKESFGGMQEAIVLAIIAIFAVLVLQFRSFAQPLIIFSALPLALIGSIWALLITGNTFSFTAFIGLISLVGIVVNNSIILVDYTNLLRKRGYSLREAVTLAGETRFTPIILTALTTIGGLLPLTLQGGPLWAPMGWTIIGGLLISTFLTLLVVPVLYNLVERRGELVNKKLVNKKLVNKIKADNR